MVLEGMWLLLFHISLLIAKDNFYKHLRSPLPLMLKLNPSPPVFLEILVSNAVGVIIGCVSTGLLLKLKLGICRHLQISTGSKACGQRWDYSPDILSSRGVFKAKTRGLYFIRTKQIEETFHATTSIPQGTK